IVWAELTSVSDISLTATLGQSEASDTVSLAPAIFFEGIKSAMAKPTTVELSWLAAEGGEGAFSYEVFSATASGTQDFDAAPLLTTSDTFATITGLTNNERVYFVVRAVDSIDDGADQNTVEYGATPGDILFVDASYSGTNSDGSASDPYLTIVDAISNLGTQVAIWVAIGNYNVANAAISVPANIHLLGGWAVADSATTIDDWTRVTGDRSTIILIPSPPTEPAFILDSGTLVDGFNSGNSFDMGYSFFHMVGVTDVIIQNVEIDAAFDGAAAIYAENSSNIRIENVTIAGSGTGGSCLETRGGSISLSHVSFTGCPDYAFRGDDTLANIENLSTFESISHDCIWAYGGMLNVDGADISNCGNNGIHTYSVQDLVVTGSVVADTSADCIRSAGWNDAPAVVIANSLSNCNNNGISVDRYYGSVDAQIIANLIINDEGTSNAGFGIGVSAYYPDTVDVQIKQNVLANVREGISVDMDEVYSDDGFNIGIIDNEIAADGRGVWVDVSAYGSASGADEIQVVGNKIVDSE
ncbi:right-handed parallel beta-helix repeat-containing protein, partial [Myxococcota bacterium]|nr:right-handed parallel beta-helix repeat-containing protein [Myxococcota bacterium]